MKPIRDFITLDMRTTGFRVDVQGAIAEGHFAGEIAASRRLAEMLREANDPIPYRITEAGRKALEDRK